MNKPLISVCIPTYNGEKYLRECFDSVLAQTFSDFEVLVVDDRSSDETINIAKEYAGQDHRIRVVQNESNLGLVGNWNRCIDLAQGEWIKFVFQDDLIQPTCLEKLISVSKPKSALICCRRNFLFEDGRTEPQKSIWTVDNLFPGLTEISANDYCKTVLYKMRYDFGVEPIKNFIGEPTVVMLRRSVFERLGIFNSYLVQFCDFELWMRIGVHLGITYVPETLATFRVHRESTTAANRSALYRLYRSRILDWLILLHDFAFDPVYAPLRKVAANHNPSINLADLFTKRAYDAWRPTLNDPKFLQEWQKVTSLDLNFPDFTKRSYPKLATDYFIFRLKRKLKSIGKKLFKRQVEFLQRA
ncbi:MAG: glycosyltransferase family 2 protein [Xenococcaceae cyanobacterium MO_188.B32]|nr:glycosyltransferase family 2 protein [Xenococcaceae cyanobacterium MO_188.B32]